MPNWLLFLGFFIYFFNSSQPKPTFDTYKIRAARALPQRKSEQGKAVTLTRYTLEY